MPHEFPGIPEHRYVTQRSSILYFQQNGSRPDTITPNVCVYDKLNLPAELAGTQTNAFPLGSFSTPGRPSLSSVQVRKSAASFKPTGLRHFFFISLSNPSLMLLSCA